MKITRLPERDSKIDGTIYTLEIVIERDEAFLHAVNTVRGLISPKIGAVNPKVPPWVSHHTIVVTVWAVNMTTDLIDSLLTVEEMCVKRPSPPQRESLKVPT